MSNRVAVYPGSFDPATYGHLDLIERAAKIFDSLIVAVARNSEKTGLFTVDERIEMLSSITKHLPNVKVTSFTGLTAEFAKNCDAIALVRGLRVVSDFEYEITMAIANQKLNPRIDTVCLLPSERFLLLSSRIVREIALFGGHLEEFVPPEVQRRLQLKLEERNSKTDS
ncbi:MAG: pantetheine-phosphate adenylyltransferase [Candidatus Hydrogenedentes bacterium]|nr:pantetheine-phosphate adenylyltransferase [Candidatus Hydrogenedentota bacterium]